MFILKYKSLSRWRHLSFTQRGTMCLRNFLNAGFQHNGVYYDTQHNPGIPGLPLGLGHLSECTKF